MGFAAPSTSVHEPLRLTYLEERISKIRENIAAHHPKVVLFHGAGLDRVFRRPYLERWSQIAGVELQPQQIVRWDGVAYVATPHPTAHGLTNGYWTALGRELGNPAT